MRWTVGLTLVTVGALVVLAVPALAGPLSPDATFSGDGRSRAGDWNLGYQSLGEKAGLTYTAGIELGAGSGENSLIVAKYGPAGDQQTTNSRLLNCWSTPVSTNVLIDDSGNVFVVGFNQNGLPGHGFVAAYDANLTPRADYADESATGCGHGTATITGVARVDSFDLEQITDASFDVDGGIVMVGRIYNDVVVVRITPDGFVDTTFGVNGLMRLRQPDTRERPATIAVDSQGRITVAATTEIPGYAARAFVARFTPDGALDETFGDNGLRSIGAFGTVSLAHGVTASDRIVVARADYSRVLVHMLTPDGALDDAFGAGSPVKRKCDETRRQATLRDLVLRSTGGRAITVFMHCRSTRSPSMVLGLRSSGMPATGFGDTGVRHLRSTDSVRDAATTDASKYLYLAGGWLYRIGT
ncbi:MAG: hypothetical protein OEV62_01585 [Actinomycetota bacterium]|nr:hypothetical protein [Actinomycetota bacterium]